MVEFWGVEIFEEKRIFFALFLGDYTQYNFLVLKPRSKDLLGRRTKSAENRVLNGQKFRNERKAKVKSRLEQGG